MARNKLVGLGIEAWADLDRVLLGVDPDEATKQVDGQSAFAWTLAHVTPQVDSWINVYFQHHRPHPLVNTDQFRMGSSGAAHEWQAIQRGVREVRAAAHPFLAGLRERDLNQTVPYSGSIPDLRAHGLTLRYALRWIAAHHYFHIGVVACQRDRLGQQVGEFPGPLTECLKLLGGSEDGYRTCGTLYTRNWTMLGG